MTSSRSNIDKNAYALGAWAFRLLASGRNGLTEFGALEPQALADFWSGNRLAPQAQLVLLNSADRAEAQPYETSTIRRKQSYR